MSGERNKDSDILTLNTIVSLARHLCLKFGAITPSIEIKMDFHKASVCLTVEHGSETWNLLRKDIKWFK